MENRKKKIRNRKQKIGKQEKEESKQKTEDQKPGKRRIETGNRRLENRKLKIWKTEKRRLGDSKEKKGNMEKRTLVKICGLRRVEDAEAANRAMPGFAGFILSQGFRRSIRLEQALELRRILNPRIRTVGVFVDADLAEIGAAAASGAIDMIQLHGKEENDYIKAITSLTSLPVIKAFPVSSKKDLEAASASAAQWILLDSGSGTGSTFDWNLLAAFLEERQQDAGDGLFPGNHPWLLAGGLSVGNVQAAIFRFRPTAVDVSSRVETDGWKDPEKMKAFVEAAHEAAFGDGPFVSVPLLSSHSGSPASAVRTTGSQKIDFGTK